MSSAPNSRNLIVLAGPTGVGKTEFAVELACQLDGEIVCGDAFQVYRGMRVLTAQPPPEAMRRVPHHLYGSVDPLEVLDAARFQKMCADVFAEILSRKKKVLFVGGAGFYIQTALCGLDPLPPLDPILRAGISQLAPEEALERLRAADPAACDAVDTRNPRRVARALEIVIQTGRPLAASRTLRDASRSLRGICLTRERVDLFARIETNVQRMFAQGVVEEVRSLGPLSSTASRTLGLAEVREVIAGRLSESAAIARIVTLTRQYAKRQETWFRNRTHLVPVPLTGRSLSAALADVLYGSSSPGTGGTSGALSRNARKPLPLARAARLSR